jgi:excisionase family DNA binding protein
MANPSTKTERIVARAGVRPALNEPLAYTIADFCRLIGIGRTTAYAMIADGTLPTAKIRGRRLVPRDAALALLSKGGK